MNIRSTSRVVLFDPEGRVLLQKVIPLEPVKSQMDSVWICPGGKLEEGETIEECAIRELYEETGISVREIGPILWRGSSILKLRGVENTFNENFIYARLKNNVSPNNGDAPEILEQKWWKIDDLISQKIRTFPFTLASLLQSVTHKEDGREVKQISYY